MIKEHNIIKLIKNGVLSISDLIELIKGLPLINFDNDKGINKKTNNSLENTKIISVIIAAKNAQLWLMDCINSIIDQELQNNWKLEILIGIDDCRETMEAATRIKNENILLFYFPKHVGTYSVFNNLVQESKGEILVRFDADDIMLNGFLFRQIELLESHSDYLITRSWSIYINNHLKPFAAQLDNGKFLGEDGKRNRGSDGQMAMKREVFELLGGYRNWQCFADSEFLLRASFLGVQLKEVSDYLYFRRVHSGAMTSSEHLGYKSKIRMNLKKRIQFFKPFYKMGIKPQKVKIKKELYVSYSR